MQTLSLMQRLVVACALCAIACPCVAATFEESQVKAVYMFNFTRFVDWPPQAFRDPAQPLNICIVGTNPFGPYLSDAIRDEHVEGRALGIRELHHGESLESCNIAFVSRSEASQLESLLRQATAQHVLTVSDIADFIRRGGAIGFETQENRVRLQINTEAARAAGLTISSKLLRIASVVAP